MTSETLYRAMGDIDERYIAEARTYQKKQKRIFIKLGSIAAALCLVLGIGLLSTLFGNGGSPFGNGDSTVYAAHREDFTPDIDSAILSQFDDPSEVKKAYLMRTNEWFLSDDLTDFSQAVTTDIVYITPGGENPSDPASAYSTYNVDAEGNIHWSCTAYPPNDASVPFGFSGLTYEMIHHALAGIEHEDYIITYAPSLGIVFIWARGATEDTILAYPTRPDLLGLDNGGFYTLAEVQTALSNAYHDCGSKITAAEHSHQNTHHTNGSAIISDDRSHEDTHQTDNHHTQENTARSFMSSMGCSDKDCTDSSHFHDCSEDCSDPAHYHSCESDCNIKEHNHPRDHHKTHH